MNDSFITKSRCGQEELKEVLSTDEIRIPVYQQLPSGQDLKIPASASQSSASQCISAPRVSVGCSLQLS